MVFAVSVSSSGALFLITVSTITLAPLPDLQAGIDLDVGVPLPDPDDTANSEVLQADAGFGDMAPGADAPSEASRTPAPGRRGEMVGDDLIESEVDTDGETAEPPAGSGLSSALKLSLIHISEPTRPY